MDKVMRKHLMMRSLKLLHILVTVLLFGVCWDTYYANQIGVQATQAGCLVAVGVYFILIILLGRIYNAYLVGTSRVSQLICSQILTAVFAAGISYILACAIVLRLMNPLPLMGIVLVQIAWCVLWSLLANRTYFFISPPRKTVIIFNSENEKRKLEEVKYFDKKFEIIKTIAAESDRSLEENLEEAEAVFLAGTTLEEQSSVMKYCIVNGIQCYFMPRVGDVIMTGATYMQSFHVPIMRIQRASLKLEYLFVKRLVDVVCALAGIVVASPFMAVTALAIKLYDGGPVLYKQVRLTKDYKEFKVLKFRSMRTDAEKDGIARLSTENDDRITPIGKIIRKIRFDELPQLFNILKGDMTIVGPRPERPEIAAQYEKEIPSFGLRLQVKAGLTGFAQVYGRYNTEPYDKLKMDLMYINNMSFEEDLRLMFATVKILFEKESTEGVSEGQITASVK